MYKANGRVKPANKKETATFRDRYFKCEKCKRITVITDVDFAEERVCDKCGANLHEINLYKSTINY